LIGCEVENIAFAYKNISVKKCSVYIECKSDIVLVNIKQHKSQS